VGFDPASGLHLIAREGQAVEVAPNDFRVFSAIFHNGGAATGEGRPISINDSGQVGFTLLFTDGSSGIFLTAVPGPSSVLLFIFTIFTVLQFSRRHYQATDRYKRITG
jgi:hypothetical protein